MHVHNYITVFSKVANSFSAITKVKLLFPNFSTLGNENWSVQRLGAKFLYVSQITWRSTETAFSDGWVFREGQSPLKGWDSHLGMASYFSKVISCILPCLVQITCCCCCSLNPATSLEGVFPSCGELPFMFPNPVSPKHCSFIWMCFPKQLISI